MKAFCLSLVFYLSLSLASIICMSQSSKEDSANDESRRSPFSESPLNIVCNLDKKIYEKFDRVDIKFYANFIGIFCQIPKEKRLVSYDDDRQEINYSNYMLDIYIKYGLIPITMTRQCYLKNFDENSYHGEIQAPVYTYTSLMAQRREYPFLVCLKHKTDASIPESCYSGSIYLL